MNIRVFSPVINGKGLSPEDYVVKYPELAQADETRTLRGVELMWCWYYSSPESPFIIKGYPDRERAVKVTELVFGIIYKGRPYEEKLLEKMYKGLIPQQWGQAIEFFRKKNSKVRAEAKTMVEKILEEYKSIIKGGVAQFQTKEEDIDYSKFSSTMKLIRNELKDLIKEVEEGFGVSEKYANIDDDEKEGDYWCKYYHKTK